MIDQLDILLRKLITNTVPGFPADEQVRFQPPDNHWRAYVKTLTVGGQPANALNLYLVDIREHRIRDLIGVVSQSLDCHYLISAWSSANETAATEPTVQEHAALYAVTAELTRNPVIVPTAIYAPGPVPAGFSAGFAEAEIRMSVAPSDGFSKLAEFWGTMGQKHRWKPVIYVIITLPILPVSWNRPHGWRLPPAI